MSFLFRLLLSVFDPITQRLREEPRKLAGFFQGKKLTEVLACACCPIKPSLAIPPYRASSRLFPREWTKPDNHAPTLNPALDFFRSRAQLILENALLRRQLIVYRRQVKRPKITGVFRS